MLQPTNQEETPSEQLTDGTPPALLTVVGSDAKLEGTFDIADSVQIECEVGGQLKVGGRLVIGERGSVRADVETGDAIIYGQYRGNMVATGSVEITPTGRVVGRIETDSLVISKGGFFNGKTAKLKEAQVEGVPRGDRRRREGLRAAIQKSSSALREGVVGDATEDHGLSPDTTHDPDTTESQAEGGPPPAFVVEGMGEPLPPLPSRGELLPEDLDPDKGAPPQDRPKRGGRRAGRSRRSAPTLREADVPHAAEDHGVSPDAGGEAPRDAVASPPKGRGRARAVPRKGRRDKTKTSHDEGPPVELKESQAEGSPPPAFVVEGMGEALPPLPSRGELLPEELDPDRGTHPGDRPGKRGMGRARAVPRKGRREKREKTDTSLDPDIMATSKEVERGLPPTFLAEDMDEPLPPLPSGGKLLPEDLDPDGGLPPADRTGPWNEGAGRNQGSGSALRGDGDDDLGDDTGTSRGGWGRESVPFPDDDPLGIR